MHDKKVFEIFTPDEYAQLPAATKQMLERRSAEHTAAIHALQIDWCNPQSFFVQAGAIEQRWLDALLEAARALDAVVEVNR